jgi:predicted transcriptional regulator
MTIRYKRPRSGRTIDQLRYLLSIAGRDSKDDAAEYLREAIKQAAEPVTEEEVGDILDQAYGLIEANRLGHLSTWGYEVKQSNRKWIDVVVYDNKIRPPYSSVDGELSKIVQALYEAGINAEIRGGVVLIAVDQEQASEKGDTQ